MLICDFRRRITHEKPFQFYNAFDLDHAGIDPGSEVRQFLSPAAQPSPTPEAPPAATTETPPTATVETPPTVELTPEAPTPTPPDFPTVQPRAKSVFAPYNPQPVDVTPALDQPAIAPDLSNVHIAMPLSADQLARLARDGVAASPGLQEKEFFTLYEKARYANVPIFITSDSLLHVYHLMFDKTLRTAEVEISTRCCNRSTAR